MNVILRDLFQGRFKAVLIDPDEAKKGYRDFVEGEKLLYIWNYNEICDIVKN
jgi:hypothetical protein